MAGSLARASQPPGFVRWANPLIRRLIGAGMPFGPNVLLTVRGRSSGRPRTFPVAILRYEGRRFVQSPFGEVNWVRNLRANGRATLTKGRVVEAVEAVELEPEAAAPVLQAAVAPYLANRFLRAILGRFFRLGRGSSRAEFVEEARRHPTFELRAPEGEADVRPEALAGEWGAPPDRESTPRDAG